MSHQMISSVDMGGVVDTMFLSGGYLFVAVTTLAEEPVIRIWNVANGQNHNLSGHKVMRHSVQVFQPA